MASNVSGFIRDLTRERWIHFSEKEGNMREEKLFKEKEKVGKMRRMEGAGVQAYPVSSKTLTIIEYLN